jgi:iron(III) transport system substrate-binding protein
MSPNQCLLNAMNPAARASMLLAGCLLLVACGQVATPSAAPASNTASDWDSLVAAAKREGKVAVIGPAGDQVNAVLVDPFQQKYGISVDLTSLAGTAATSRIMVERGAGQYNLDILISGSAGILESLIPSKAVEPIESALVLPEVKDPKNWRGGELPVIGPNREILVMTPYQRGTLFYNKNLVKGDEIKSYKDLLDPKWKDKMQMDDPRRPGPGNATFIFFYLHPELGADFIRALAKQNITIQNDYQQEIDVVGQGRAPLMIGATDRLAEARIKQGAPIGIVPSTQLKEGTDVSAASGNLSLFNRAPHRNAAKVYVNWLLTKDAQEAYARSSSLTSARADVNGDWAQPWRYPAPGAIRSDGEAAIAVREKLAPVVKEAFGAG